MNARFLEVPAFAALRAHADVIREQPLATLVAQPGRRARLQREAEPGGRRDAGPPWSARA